MLKLFTFLCVCIFTVYAYNVTMVASQTSLIINQLSNYTFTILRNSDSSGNSIVPSTLSTQSLITLYFPSFTLSNASCPSNLTCAINSTAIVISNYFATNSSQTTVQLVINNIINPVASNTLYTISCIISTNAQTIDTAQITTSFQPSTFLNYSISFLPGNVSYNSNLSVTLTPSVGIASGGKVNITLPTYYTQSKKNVTINVPSTVVCTTSCSMSVVLNSIVITVANIVASSNVSFNIVINGVISCPTTQRADSISIVSFDSSGNQLDTLYTTIGSTLPNYFNLNNIVSGVINTPFTLSFNFFTSNIFAANDSITLTLPSSISLSSSSLFTLSSTSINLYSTEYILPNIIKISNITTYSSSFNSANFSFSLTNVNGPNTTAFIYGLLVQIYRNGYIYNYGQAGFNAIPAQLTITNAVSSTIVGVNSTYNLSLSLKNTIPTNGSIVITLPNTVALLNCSDNYTSTTCTIATNTVILNFTNPYTNSILNLSIFAVNPVTSSNLNITACSYDTNYNSLDCGTLTFFQVTSTTLPSSTISSSSSSMTVYDIAIYSLNITLANYTITNGYATVTLPTSLSFVNVSTFTCTINSNPFCINQSLTSPITISFAVTANTSTYLLVISNIRNPLTTQQFQFSVTIADSANFTYYNIIGGYNSMIYPYLSTSPTYTTTNCTNSANANYTFTFTVPFQVSNASLSVYFNNTIISTITYTNPAIVANITNSRTLQPYSLFFNVTTRDLLYLIFNSTITITNCQPSYMPISGSISGLPYDTSVISISFATIGDKIQVVIPSDYNTTNLVCTPLTNLTCNLLTSNTLQIIPVNTNVQFQLSNITNPFNSTYFSFLTYSNFYLMSSNNNTLQYLPQCPLPCKSCSPVNTTVCTSCYNNTYSTYYIYDSLNNNCTNLCPSGQYQNGSTCIVCPAQCITCSNAVNCTTCNTGYYFYNYSCLSSCPSKYFINSTNCSSCVQPCSTCLNSTTCQTCINNYYFYLNSCLSPCPNTTVGINGTCISCNNNCATCLNNASYCTSCFSGSFQYNFTCLIICPDGYIGLDTSCVLCSICATCTINASTCTSCNNPLYLYNNSCVAQCPFNYYPSGTQCLSCPSQCLSCTSITVCLSCNSNYYLYNSSCLSSCPLGTLVVSQSCLSCMTGCYNCSNVSTCNACTAQYFYYNSQCVTSCPNGTTSNSNNTCINCSSTCTSCNNSICSTCVSGYYLYQGDCLTVCPNNTIVQNYTCIACSILYSNCFTCSSSGCVACTSPYYYFNSSCYQTCPTGIPVNSICTSCSQGCTSCNNIISNCSTCLSGYILFNSTCVVTCPSMYILMNSTCVSCPVQCQTCTSLTFCLTCNTNFYLYNNFCVNSCPDGYYGSNQYCVACQTGCSNCNSTTCTVCSSGFYIGNGVCYASCPTSLPYPINSTCNKCNVNCLQCTASQCLSCNNSLYSYGSTCVSTCPTQYTISNFTCTSNTNITLQSTLSSSNQNVIPFPFSISFVILAILATMSRMQHENTYVFGCISSFSSVLYVCSMVAIIIVQSIYNEITVGLYLILIALVLQLVCNGIYMIISSIVDKNDTKYQQWKNRKNKNYFSSILLKCLSVINFRIQILQFSKLFNLEIFKACYETTKKFYPYNILMIVALLLCNFTGIIAAGITSNIHVYLKDQLFFMGLDVVLLGVFDIVFGLLTIKKEKSFFEYRPETKGIDSASTIKNIANASHEEQVGNCIFDQKNVLNDINNSNQQLIKQSERNQLLNDEFTNKIQNKANSIFSEQYKLQSEDDLLFQNYASIDDKRVSRQGKRRQKKQVQGGTNLNIIQGKLNQSEEDFENQIKLDQQPHKRHQQTTDNKQTAKESEPNEFEHEFSVVRYMDMLITPEQMKAMHNVLDQFDLHPGQIPSVLTENMNKQSPPKDNQQHTLAQQQQQLFVIQEQINKIEEPEITPQQLHAQSLARSKAFFQSIEQQLNQSINKSDIHSPIDYSRDPTLKKQNSKSSHHSSPMSKLSQSSQYFKSPKNSPKHLKQYDQVQKIVEKTEQNIEPENKYVFIESNDQLQDQINQSQQKEAQQEINKLQPFKQAEHNQISKLTDKNYSQLRFEGDINEIIRFSSKNISTPTKSVIKSNSPNLVFLKNTSKHLSLSPQSRKSRESSRTPKKYQTLAPAPTDAVDKIIKRNYLNQSPRLYPFKFNKFIKNSIEQEKPQELDSPESSKMYGYDNYTPRLTDVANQRVENRVRYQQNDQVLPENARIDHQIEFHQQNKQYEEQNPNPVFKFSETSRQHFRTDRSNNRQGRKMSQNKLFANIISSNQKSNKKKLLQSVYLKSLKK